MREVSLVVPDATGKVGFEMQYEGGYVAPGNMTSQTSISRFILSALGQVFHGSEQDRSSSTILQELPLFSVTTDHTVGTAVSPNCPASVKLDLPSALVCAKMEVVSKPMPITQATGAADAIRGWEAMPRQAEAHSDRRSSWILRPVAHGPVHAARRQTRWSSLRLNFSAGRVWHTYRSDLGVRPQVGSIASLLQLTFAVPLDQLWLWLDSAVCASDRVKEYPSRPKHFSRFLRRVRDVCDEDAVPESYCGFLAIAGHVMRTVGRIADSRTLTSFMGSQFPKASINSYGQPSHKLPYSIPLIVRTNFASMYAHMKQRVARERPEFAMRLPTLLMKHMERVLREDLLHGLDTALLNTTVRTYYYATAPCFLEVVALVTGRQYPLDGALEWLLQKPIYGLRSQQRRQLFTRVFEAHAKNRSRIWIAKAPGEPLLVRDWILGVCNGLDWLSDHSSPASRSHPGPVFKSMGSWAIGSTGDVHLEATDGGFNNWWNAAVDGTGRSRVVNVSQRLRHRGGKHMDTFTSAAQWHARFLARLHRPVHCT